MKYVLSYNWLIWLKFNFEAQSGVITYTAWEVLKGALNIDFRFINESFVIQFYGHIY